MLQGTASGVGKSVLTAGLCRLLAREGISVAPFKPQNMSNNAAVTCDGGEIGRAQALQAFACGLQASVDMNPVLIKPESDQQAQWVVLGQSIGRKHAQNFKKDRQALLPTVLAAFQRLQQQYDLVLVEGAGSPAEPNLMHNDIANMGFARAANISVCLIGDIDKGGVFAALKGTLDILEKEDRKRIKGILINRFRGNRALLQDAITWMQQQKPVFGVIPYLSLRLPDEDIPYQLNQHQSQGHFHIAVIAYPHMSNHDDVDPFRQHRDINIRLLSHASQLQTCDLLILPGSKHVVSDLAWLRQQGFEQAITRHLRYGGKVLGICGGLQMLGKSIHDPQGIEQQGTHTSLGLIDSHTHMEEDKTRKNIAITAKWPEEQAITGYEIHHGSSHDSHTFPFNHVSDDQQIMTTYLHGLFDSATFRQSFLKKIGLSQEAHADQSTVVMQSLDHLADTLATNLDPLFLEQLGYPQSRANT
ncbi:MAG: cobyric acid synthase [Mariprofundaceae bacterium]|nr:cobyric acid synthase [Mariprofundaceae bacterium]